MYPVFKGYFGTSFGVIIIIIFLLFCYHSRKKNISKYINLASFIFIILIPILFLICRKFNMLDVVYRFFWIFPLCLMGAYVCVEVMRQKRNVLLIILLICFFYTNCINSEKWSLPDNVYKISNEIIEIADIIEINSNGKKVKVIGEVDFMMQIRQYSAKICWGYPNAISMIETDSRNEDDESVRLADAIQNNYFSSNMDILGDLEALKIDYLVIYQNNGFINKLSKENYDIIGETRNYKILKVNY